MNVIFQECFVGMGVENEILWVCNWPPCTLPDIGIAMVTASLNGPWDIVSAATENM